MSLTASLCDELFSRLALAGAAGWGIARAEPVEAEAREFYLDSLSQGNHASMEWMARNLDARFTVDKILEGAMSVISVAFAYPEAPEPRSSRHPRWAAYALGDDYHEVIRRRLAPVASWLDCATGSASRVCVDTAPVMERYWAVKAGVGFRACNGMVIVPGIGSRVFLAEIFTTAPLNVTRPAVAGISCGNCGRCMSSCPGGALKGDGTVDARKCLSYLTIEHRGELPGDTPLGDKVYGCDTCRQVCPHENAAFTRSLGEFQPRDSILRLDVDALSRLTQEQFSTIFSHNAVKRAKLAGLLRNVKLLLNQGRL